jgi:hypothetical protein
MDGELVEIVLRFQKLQDSAIRLESRLGELPLRRTQEELSSLRTAILEEIDRSTERQPALPKDDQPANAPQSAIRLEYVSQVASTD